MKTITRMGAQGDVMLIRAKEVPQGFLERPRNPGEPLVIAHSETGHHHSIHDAGVQVFEPNNPADSLVCYLRVEGDSFDLVHHRPYHTHETLRFQGSPGAVWEVRRQREHTPEGWRRVQD